MTTLKAVVITPFKYLPVDANTIILTYLTKLELAQKALTLTVSDQVVVLCLSGETLSY